MRVTSQKREEKERVRHALFRAALHLGSEHGFSSLGLREVARAASIAPTSFYRHFADMPELGVRLVEELVRPLFRAIAEEPAAKHAGPTQPEAIAGQLVDGLLGASAEDPELLRFVVAQRVGSSMSLRKALAEELAVLTRAFSQACPARDGPWAGAATALLLEGAARALELTPPEHVKLREDLVACISLMLADGQRNQESP